MSTSSSKKNPKAVSYNFLRPSLWHWFCGIMVSFVTLACALTGQISIHRLISEHAIFYGIVTPFLLSYFSRKIQTHFSSAKHLAGFLALLFSQFVTVGSSFFLVHSWALCFGDWKALLIWALRSMIYGYVFYQILWGILSIIGNHQTLSSNTPVYNCIRWFFLIVAVRIIFLVLFYPCVFGFDAAVGLRTFLDPDCATCNHHPYFIQFLHCMFFSIGKSIGHLSVGMALLSFLSILFSTGIILYGLKLLERSQISNQWFLTIAVLYTLFPLYPYLSVTPTKDGLFAYSFLFYLITLFHLAVSKGACLHSLSYMLLHSSAILLVCLTRHQGVFIVIVECILLLLCYKNVWKRIFLVSASSLCLLFAYYQILLPYNNVEPGGKQEVYGILFQQTALFLKQHPNDVTTDELDAINRVLNKDTIIAKYTFNKTDPVKNGYKYNPWYRPSANGLSMFRHIDRTHEANDLRLYRSAWLSMGLRHPSCYLEATFAVTAGFFYNFNKPILETSPYWANYSAAITPEYRFAHFTTVARFYNNIIYSWFKYPIINWVIAIPYYNWAAFFFLSLIFYTLHISACFALVEHFADLPYDLWKVYLSYHDGSTIDGCLYTI